MEQNVIITTTWKIQSEIAELVSKNEISTMEYNGKKNNKKYYKYPVHCLIQAITISLTMQLVKILAKLTQNLPSL